MAASRVGVLASGDVETRDTCIATAVLPPRETLRMEGT